LNYSRNGWLAKEEIGILKGKAVSPCLRQTGDDNIGRLRVNDPIYDRILQII
jgi:hypothetical protein